MLSYSFVALQKDTAVTLGLQEPRVEQQKLRRQRRERRFYHGGTFARHKIECEKDKEKGVNNKLIFLINY